MINFIQKMETVYEVSLLKLGLQLVEDVMEVLPINEIEKHWFVITEILTENELFSKGVVVMVLFQFKYIFR